MRQQQRPQAAGDEHARPSIEPPRRRLGHGRAPGRSTTVSRLPTCIAAWPQARAKLVQKMHRAADRAPAQARRARSRLNPSTVTRPRAAKVSSAGSRRRIGPPGSHRQVSSAPSPASPSAGMPQPLVERDEGGDRQRRPHPLGQAERAQVEADRQMPQVRVRPRRRSQER